MSDCNFKSKSEIKVNSKNKYILQSTKNSNSLFKPKRKISFPEKRREEKRREEKRRDV